MSGQPEGVRAALNDLAREWALCDERERADHLCELLVRAAEQELLREARAHAARLVGQQLVDDVINEVWERVLRRGSFQPGRGSFAAFFHTVLHHHCIDVLRQRNRDAMPVADEAIERAHADAGSQTGSPAGDPDALDRLADLEGRVSAAIEVLDLPPRYAGMLRLMAGPSDNPPGADGRAPAAGNVPSDADARQAARTRQDRARLRKKIDALASLTQEELWAAGLIRKFHSVAAAAAADDGVDEQLLRRTYAAATAKILALFGLGSKD